MRVIRKGIEKEIICPCCNSFLYYKETDIISRTDSKGNYFPIVVCPECYEKIKIK